MKKIRYVIGGNAFFDMIVHILLFIVLCLMLYPLLYVISASVSDADAVTRGELVLLPVDFTLKGYRFVLINREIWVGYANTILYTVVGTIINLIVTLPCAYALSRKEVPGRSKWMIFFMITMYINGGLIPNYLNVKSLGLLDTRLYMIIGGALSVYNMIVARTFFENTIPYELIEASKIDGCNVFRSFSAIVLPLSKPLMAVMVLYYGVGHWNSYFGAMIYLRDRMKFPLQLFLREILLTSKMVGETLTNASNLSMEEIAELLELAKSTELTKYCVIVVSTLPMMVLYPWLQKFFVKGIMIGAVKG